MKLASCLHGNGKLWLLEFKSIATAFSGYGAEYLAFCETVAGAFTLADTSTAGCIST
jgi:hypothetical protein